MQKGITILALAYLRLGGPTYLKLAFEELNKAVEFDPNLTDAHLKIGEFYFLSLILIRQRKRRTLS